MDEEEYSNSVLANSCVSWNEMFDEGDKILVILYDEPKEDEE